MLGRKTLVQLHVLIMVGCYSDLRPADCIRNLAHKFFMMLLWFVIAVYIATYTNCGEAWLTLRHAKIAK